MATPQSSPQTDTTWLNTLAFCRVRITLRAQRDGYLPGFSTSLLRGWLGHQLQRLCVCRFLGPAGFAQCSFKQSCAWGVFFADLSSSTALRPYLFELDSLTSDQGQQFTARDTLPVTLLLIGHGMAQLDAIVGALMIDGGVIRLGRQQLPCLYDLATSVCHYQGPKPDFAALLAQANAIECHQTDLRWIDFRRFSARQQNLMDFGGLVGSISFSGDFSPFLPYLLLGAELHIGRHTSFGFGQFRCMFGATEESILTPPPIPRHQY